MRFFYDTEFIEDGKTIELISIGVVAEAPGGGPGEEFYAVSTGFDPGRAGDWVRRNVLDKLPNPSDKAWRSNDRIRDDLFEFLTRNAAGGPIEMWAWVGAYDHVAVCQLWGDMPALPQQMPRFTRELKQLWELSGRPKLPEIPSAEAHSALADARHNVAKFEVIRKALDAKGITI
ncbi:polyadenylate-specific 3'-exoribonuclease AS [Dietzia sp.]|uniref:polyadenylate-specific 3'-exoribonuclease AS n=1 Tax=Dietzia sp. TaxID=1871616 RepID=UPI002FD9995E